MSDFSQGTCRGNGESTRSIVVLLLGLVLLFRPGEVTGTEVGLRLGPAAVGNGGSNPVSIPPSNPIDYEFYLVGDSQWVLDLSVSPGLFYGWRTKLGKDLYASMGPGLAINANGAGPGVFGAIGYMFTCESFCFGIEVKQALGITSGGLISPYAMRLSFGWNM